MFRQSCRMNVTSCILQGLCCDNRWPPVHLSSLHRPQPPPGPGHRAPHCTCAPHVQFSRSNDPPPCSQGKPWAWGKQGLCALLGSWPGQSPRTLITDGATGRCQDTQWWMISSLCPRSPGYFTGHMPIQAINCLGSPVSAVYSFSWTGQGEGIGDSLENSFHFLMCFVIRNTKLRRFNRKPYFLYSSSRE